LDGLASPHGQIFVLTTNHPELLDPAMLRKGRVDVTAEFPHASPQQVSGMFKSFYPESTVEQQVLFASTLKKESGEETMNLAALQDFFIQNRLNDSKTALSEVKTWVDQQEAAKKAMQAFEAKNKKEAKEAEAEGDAVEEVEEVAVVPEQPTATSKKSKKSKAKNSELSLFTFGLVAAAAVTYLIRSHQ
jgi:SpoVK/Ycf46/Vps4 family AAA+-type ATPase